MPDLPKEPHYPGKPLAHRFSPLDNARMVEEANSDANIASAHPFQPISSVSFPDKSIYLGPVSNVKHRGLSPVPLEGSVSLPIKGERVFEFAEELRKPLEARIGRLIENATVVKSAPPIQTPPIPSQGPVGNMQTELEALKQLARQELAKRSATPVISAQPAVSTSTPTVIPPQKIEEQPIPVGTPAGSKPLSVPLTEKEKGGFDETTQKILSEAEKLEAELSRLQQEFSAPGSQPVAVSPTPTPITQAPVTVPTVPQVPLPAPLPEHAPAPAKDEHIDQIGNLIKERSELLQKVNQLTATQDEVLQKLKKAETEMTGLASQLKNLEQEKGILTGQVEALKTERDKMRGTLLSTERITGELEGLKNQTISAQQEKSQAQEQIKKLEAFIAELQTSHQQQKAIELRPVEPATPTPMPETLAPAAEPRLRVVRPQVAVGKMAPSLTTAPNVINGIVKDSQGMLLSNVVIVVKDPNGEPVRALKTNKIGQFAISTPLPNGIYTMELESPEHTFDLIEVELKGAVLLPVEIRANN